MADILSNLRAPAGSNTPKRRKGRGLGSGLGKTAGHGQKGQKARHPGNFGKLGFQGGQTPLQRRLPKRGFRNALALVTSAVNLGDIAKKFEANATVDIVALKAAGLVRNWVERVKLLGGGEIKQALTIKVHAASGSAQEKVKAAGGKIELIVTEPKAETKDAPKAS